MTIAAQFAKLGLVDAKTAAKADRERSVRALRAALENATRALRRVEGDTLAVERERREHTTASRTRPMAVYKVPR